MPSYFNDISYIIESDIRRQNMSCKKGKINKTETFQSFSSDETCIAKHSDVRLPNNKGA